MPGWLTASLQHRRHVVYITNQSAQCAPDTHATFSITAWFVATCTNIVNVNEPLLCTGHSLGACKRCCEEHQGHASSVYCMAPQQAPAGYCLAGWSCVCVGCSPEAHGRGQQGASTPRQPLAVGCSRHMPADSGHAGQGMHWTARAAGRAVGAMHLKGMCMHIQCAYVAMLPHLRCNSACCRCAAAFMSLLSAALALSRWSFGSLTGTSSCSPRGLRQRRAAPSPTQ
jgi:hypothetical protein